MLSLKPSHCATCSGVSVAHALEPEPAASNKTDNQWEQGDFTRRKFTATPAKDKLKCGKIPRRLGARFLPQTKVSARRSPHSGAQAIPRRYRRLRIDSWIGCQRRDSQSPLTDNLVNSRSEQRSSDSWFRDEDHAHLNYAGVQNRLWGNPRTIRSSTALDRREEVQDRRFSTFERLRSWEGRFA